MTFTASELNIRRRSASALTLAMETHYQLATVESPPRNILEEIVWHKEAEVAQMRDRLSLRDLQRQIADVPPARDFLAALQAAPCKPAVIAEVKKASPSKGVIRPDFDPVAIAQSYAQGGATCLSVLTDQKFFQGSFAYLAQIRAAVDLPLLCKDFLIYPYQIYLARLKGADAVLLIAAILSNQDLAYFSKIVHVLGMTALVEVHTLAELDRVLQVPGVSLVGINNRNLENFSVDLGTTLQLMAARSAAIGQKGLTIVSESGLYTAADLQRVAGAGATAVLIGESLMRQSDPGIALQQLLAEMAGRCS